MVDGQLRVFIGSSSEGVGVAEAICAALRAHPNVEPRLWSAGAFKPSQVFIESLEAELRDSDFAVLVLTPDDALSTPRGDLIMTPRDNLLFELGLFMGHLGRERVYFLYDRKQKLKIPTDLLGVAATSYELQDGQVLHEALANPSSSIVRRMTELDARQKYSIEMESEHKLVMDFCRRITGTWWGRQMLAGGETRLALLRIILEPEGNTVRLDGETFTKNGMLFGKWKSVAMGLRASERTLTWAWEGRHPWISPGEEFGGFGRYTFDHATDVYDRAEGMFSDMPKGGTNVSHWTSLELRRVEAADLERIERVMYKGNDSDRAAEIIGTMDRFSRSAYQS